MRLTSDIYDPSRCYYLEDKVALALLFDLNNTLHCGDSVGPQLPVIFHGDVATLLELECGVHRELFACGFRSLSFLVKYFFCIDYSFSIYVHGKEVSGKM